jgi:hypothetical protein
MSLDLSATATALMKSLGDETYVTITRKSGGTFDPVEGTTTGAVTNILPAVGVVVKLDSRLVDGTRIKATDKMILLDKEVTPLYTDLITFGGIDHTVVDIGEINHAGITQLWKVICRG